MEINNVQVKGYLGSWAKLTNIGNQQTACYNNTISVPRYNTQTKKNEYSTFNLTAFGRTAEDLNSLPEKTLVIVTDGKLLNNEYKNKDGIEVKQVKILVNDFEVLGNKYDYKPTQKQLANTAKQVVSGNGIKQFDDPTDYSNSLNIDSSDLPF